MPADLQRARELFLHAVGKLPAEQWDGFVAEACRGDAGLEQQVRHLLQVHREAGSFLESPAVPGVIEALAGHAFARPTQAEPAGGGGEDESLELLTLCADDPALRERIIALLRAQAAAGRFVESPAPGPIETVEEPLVGEAPGTAIGPYTLIEQIGEGGMGTVWTAQQTEPVRRLVAVKLIKAGMDSRQVIARFEAERQALALMDHPNIAKVVDGGTTGTGRPYFVMELVKGQPITRYCDEHHLTPRQRLDLFVPVCHAVQHAHQKGIIHRDLKPSNVLVALYDDKPVPKVIDFGVAKAAGQSLTDKTLATGFGNIVGTPEYMSPEQAEINQRDIDTRSDIYSLGVLLYELLAGSPPFSRKELEKAGVLEMLRVIREQEPSRPSTKLSTAECLPTLAANRGTDPARLTRLVRGELDWIVMKALEKDRNRRYETANGFSMDVQRYLADEPVKACPPSAGYRMSKFARRNRVGLAAAVGIVSAVLAGLGVSTWQAVRATRAEVLAAERLSAEVAAGERAKANEARAVTEARRATAVADLLQQMLASANPDVAQKAGVTVRELLDAFAAGLGDQLQDQPEVEATVRQVIGRSYWRLDLSAEAAPQLDRAVALRRQTPGTDPKLLAESLAAWGRVLFELKQLTPARAALEQALALHRQAGSSPRAVIEAMASLHMVARAEERADEGTRLLAEGRELARALPGGDDPGLACMLHVQAVTLRQAGRPAEAERLARDAVAMHRRTRRPNDVELAHGLTEWGRCLQALKRHDEAEAPLKEAVAIFRVHFPEVHPWVGIARDPLLETLRARGKAHEADQIVADDIRDPLTPDRRDLTGWLSWADARQAAGQWELAWQGYSEAARLPGPAVRGTRARIGNRLLAVVKSLRGRSRREDAVTGARQAVAILEEALADDPAGFGATEVKEDLADGLSLLGETLTDLGRHPEAVEAYRKAVAQSREVLAADPKGAWPREEYAFRTRRLSEALRAAGRPEEAEEAARAALRLHEELLAGAPGNDLYRERLWWAYGTLLLSLENQGKLDEAVAGLRAALRIYPDTALARGCLARVMEVQAYALATDPDVAKRDPGRAIKLAKAGVELVPEFADCWNTLGVAHYRAGEWKDAIVALQKGREIDDQWSNPFFLAMTHWQLGEKDEARRWYDKGVRWTTRWARTNPSLIRFRDEAAQLLGVAEQSD